MIQSIVGSAIGLTYAFRKSIMRIMPQVGKKNSEVNESNK